MAENKYNYMALFVDVKTGKVKQAFGAKLNKGKYTPDVEAYDVPETRRVPLNPDTSITTIETFYASSSPG